MPDFDSMPTTPSQSQERKNESDRRQCGTMARYGTEAPMAGRQNANRPKYQNLATTQDHLSFMHMPSEASAPPERATGADSGTVIVSKLNVRQGPGTHHKVIGSLRRGTTIAIAEKHGDWFAINYDGKQAFVKAEFARIGTMAQPSPNNATALADLQTGIAGEDAHSAKMPEKAKAECAPPKPEGARTNFINTYMCSAYPSLGNTSFCQKLAENTASDAPATTQKSDAIPKHAQTMPVPPQGTARVMSKKLNVRSKPDAKSKSVGSLNEGDTIDYTAISDDGNWLQAELGWVSKELTDANAMYGARRGMFTKDKDLAALGSEAAELAKSYQGWTTGDLAQMQSGEIFSKKPKEECVQLPKLSTLAYIPRDDNNNGYDKNCANFVSAILVEAGLIHKAAHVNRVRDLVRLLIDNGWQLIPKSQARPGDVWESVGHAEIVTGQDKGKVTTFGSNNNGGNVQTIGASLKDPDGIMGNDEKGFRKYLDIPDTKAGKEKEKALLKEFNIDLEKGSLMDLKPILANLAMGKGEGPDINVLQRLIELKDNKKLIKACGERIWGIRGYDAGMKHGEAADVSR